MSELLTCSRILSFMTILGFIIHHMLRVNMSIAIVEMISTKNSTSSIHGPQFNWNQQQKNTILGIFFLGYMLTQVPGGRLSEMFGSRIVVGTGLLAASFLTILTPPAIYVNYYCVLTVRFALGLSLGIQWPSLFSMAARWIPPEDNSKFLSHALASSLGAALTLPICGYLITYCGWPSVFYVTGTTALVWTITWFYLIYDSPREHPRISKQEKEVLEGTLQTNFLFRKMKTPWKELLTSGPVWAIIVAGVCDVFPFFVIFNHLPTYMNDVLRFNIKENGWLSSLPYLGKYATAVISSCVADQIVQTQKFSKTAVRKSFAVFLLFGPFLLFSVQAIWGDNRVLSVVVFIGCMCFMGLAPPTILSNAMDISPYYSGTVFGISQLFNSIAGYFTTQLVTLVVKDKEDFKQWSYVFWILAGISLFGLIFFLMFASAEVQRWNPTAEEENMKKCTDEDTH